MWIAEYDTQGMEFPTCVHVTKTTGTMTHGATYVPIEEGKAVRVENAKLRERVAELEELTNEKRYIPQEWYQLATTENAKLRELVDELYPLADNGAMDASELDKAHDLMRELGIEVDE